MTGPHITHEDPHGPTMVLRAFLASLPEGEGACESRAWPEGLESWRPEPADYPRLYRVAGAGPDNYPVNFWCEGCVQPFARMDGCDFPGETPGSRWRRQAHEVLFCGRCGQATLWPIPPGRVR